MNEEQMEEFMFNLLCLGQFEMREVGEWIYFIHGNDLSEEGDGTIWRIRRDGTEMKKLQKSNDQVRGIIGIDERWIYFMAKESVGSVNTVFPKIGGCWNYRKMTILGGLERNMTASEYDHWEDEIDELQEEC